MDETILSKDEYFSAFFNDILQMLVNSNNCQSSGYVVGFFFLFCLP